jgi:tRNA A58 N-methylase Trm61
MNTKEHEQICPAKLAEGLDDPIRKSVLEVEHCTEFFSTEIAKMLNDSGKVIAVDVQEDMIDIIRKKIKVTKLEQRIELHKSNYESTGIVEDVDFVLACWMAHDIQNPKRFFEELISTLKPDGLIFIIDPKFDVSEELFKTMADIIKEYGFTTVEGTRVFFSPTQKMFLYKGETLFLKKKKKKVN